MERRRVLLLCVESLLGESLERILGQLEDVELVGPWELGADVLARLPEGMPDIALVVEEEESENVASLTGQILEHYPDLPVVRIGLQENVMRVYASRTLPARSADLIDVIRGLSTHHLEGTGGSRSP